MGHGWPAGPLPFGRPLHALLLGAAIQQALWWRHRSNVQAARLQHSHLLLLLAPHLRSLRQAGGSTQQQQRICAARCRLLPCCQPSAHALNKQLPQ